MSKQIIFNLLNLLLTNYHHLNCFSLKTFSPKWTLFSKIHFLRKNGVYNNFVSFDNNNFKHKLKKINKFKQKKTDLKPTNTVINYHDNFFKIMKNLRYLFLSVFLKKSKKLIKIRKYIKSKNIVTHPHIFENLFKVEIMCLGVMPAPLVRSSLFFLQRWSIFIKNIFFRNRLIYTTNSSVEYDCAAGSFKKLWNVNGFSKCIFWPIFIKVLYWRLYAM